MIHASLVIPMYNARDTLPAMLDSIEAQDEAIGSFETIIVDDGSTDDSRAIAAARPWCRVLTQANCGPGAARNLGAQRARGEIIIYTDADCVLPSDFVRRHIEMHALRPDVDGLCGGVTPATRLPLGSPVLADHLCSWFNAHDALPPRTPEYMWGANMSVKRRVLAAGVAWSADRITGEDVDFSLQMRRRGMVTTFAPEIAVRHTDRATFSGFLRHQYNWGFHAPFIRGRNPDAAYAFLFPAGIGRARLVSPIIVAGYTALTIKAWWRRRPLALLSALPIILLGKIAYARGVLAGTRAMAKGLGDRVADRRAA